MVRELRRLADAAPDGEVLAIAEEAAVDLGRRFARDRLQEALNAQVGEMEQRGGEPGPTPAAGPGGITDGRSAGSPPPPT